jgi:FKBP-type peptidyl-prolyl cis-trans isomerase (trigger factor)
MYQHLNELKENTNKQLQELKENKQVNEIKEKIQDIKKELNKDRKS